MIRPVGLPNRHCLRIEAGPDGRHGDQVVSGCNDVASLSGEGAAEGSGEGEGESGG